MKVYYAYYKRQYYNRVSKLWVDTFYTHQCIVVIADSELDAKNKIEKCLPIVESGGYRAVLVSEINECLGLNLCHGFDGSFDVTPIVERD